MKGTCLKLKDGLDDQVFMPRFDPHFLQPYIFPFCERPKVQPALCPRELQVMLFFDRTDLVGQHRCDKAPLLPVSRHLRLPGELPRMLLPYFLCFEEGLIVPHQPLQDLLVCLRRKRTVSRIFRPFQDIVQLAVGQPAAFHLVPGSVGNLPYKTVYLYLVLMKGFHPSHVPDSRGILPHQVIGAVIQQG